MSRDSFASPRVPALSERKNTSRLACVCFDRVVFAQAADVKFYFYASLCRIFSSNGPHRFIFHVLAVPAASHLRLQDELFTSM